MSVRFEALLMHPVSPSSDVPVPMIFSLFNSAIVNPFISLSSYKTLLFSSSTFVAFVVCPVPSNNRCPEPIPDSNAISIPSLNVLNGFY